MGFDLLDGPGVRINPRRALQIQRIILVSQAQGGCRARSMDVPERQPDEPAAGHVILEPLILETPLEVRMKYQQKSGESAGHEQREVGRLTHLFLEYAGLLHAQVVRIQVHEDEVIEDGIMTINSLTLFSHLLLRNR